MKKDFLKIGLARVSQDLSVGQECFENIAKMLGELLEVEYVIIGFLDEEDKGQIQTVAILENDKIVKNMKYSLEGTPCVTITGRTMQFFGDNLEYLFPTDVHIKNWQARGYLGAPIFDMQNTPLGLIALLSKSKIEDSAEKRSLLQICASKVGSEVDHIKYVDKLKRVNLAVETEIRARTAELENLTQTISESLSESEEKYRLLFENNTDALVHNIPSFSSHFVTVNKSAVMMFGMDSENELKKYGPKDLSPELQPDGQNSSIKGIEMVSRASKEGSHVFEWRHKRKSGEEFDCMVTLTAVTIKGNKLIQASMRDITESNCSKELLIEKEKELERAEKITRMGRWKWNVLTDKVDWSYIQRENYGWDLKAEVPNYEDMAKLHTPESFERLSAAVEKILRDGMPYIIDLELVLPDGSNRWIQGTGEVLKRDIEGRAIVLSGTGQDITERKKLEHDLQEALKARDTFLGVASHELKTPLTTLQLQIHSLIRTLNDPNSEIPREKVQAKLNILKRQGERFEQLFKSLLDMSQINSGKLRLRLEKNLNLSELTEEIAQRFQEEFLVSNTELHLKIEPNIVGHLDSQRVDQIISNLLSNALKYGEGKPVELVLKRNNDFARIEVKDQGIGIADSVKEKIFERFERAVDEHSFKGLGLGLWIVREILKSCHGKIWVESETNKGSTFVVELPLDIGDSDEG
jgi:PAS domain S-box-containing protein